MPLYSYAAVGDDRIVVESVGQNSEPLDVQQQPQQPEQQQQQQQQQPQQPVQQQQPQQPVQQQQQQQPVQQQQQQQQEGGQAPSSSSSTSNVDFLALATSESQPEGGDDETMAVTALQIGARIEANYLGQGKYYGGNIAQFHVSDGTYDVRYDDGDSEAHVAIDRIRLLADPSSSSGSSPIMVPLVASTDAITTLAPSSGSPVAALAVGTRCKVNYRGNIIHSIPMRHLHLPARFSSHAVPNLVLLLTIT